MTRIYNFSAGPSMLPVEVLEKAASEMLDYNGSGMSVMEMSHRSKVYDGIIKETEAKFRKIMGIPDNYKVLFLQGGATLQFAMVPLNLLTGSGKADYVVSGNFSNNAYKEAQKFGTINLAGTSKADNFAHIPQQDELTLDPEADYVHLCTNNTIYGTTWKYIPETGNVPIVADMSSCILSEPVDVTKYGLIYAGAQKNMGPAGLTVVIIREDLAGKTQPKTPVMLDYKVMIDNDSMYNTPPTYGIYILKLVLEWIEKLGGLSEMEKINRAKAKVLYDFLDESKMFKSTVLERDRSMMNVTFKTGDEALDDKFVKESKAAGFENLKGHRAVGGMRASIYNAMPTEGVVKLVEFMREFEARNS
ncbi:3-phosphoserine/phosphohydroxythreonine transaminase [Youngiibacter fragilis]|uniref:Phosphoserine aminotransferase n=1 Tax=Youngiibacter fragilis 232.1 TaxID=994573 RepID=V7I335_9CLOT|nr:3-phosphoserine/phosphohydroxythreonine transaminase [Youngiibacter fragilis]ETA79427.1 MFS transporter [Youngiibacter fragilis 232.1]